MPLSMRAIGHSLFRKYFYINFSIEFKSYTSTFIYARKWQDILRRPLLNLCSRTCIWSVQRVLEKFQTNRRYT